MSFAITKVELKDGVEIWRDRLPVPFATKGQAWTSATERASHHERWDVSRDLSHLTCGDGSGGVFRYYVHDSRFAPEPVNEADREVVVSLVNSVLQN